MWTVFNCLGRNKSLTQCGKNLWKKSIRESQHHSLTMFIWVALNEHAKRAKILWKITETCLNPESLLGLSKKTTLFRETRREHFLMVLWHGKSCKEMRGNTLRTGEQNNSTVIQSRNTMPWWPKEIVNWKKQINSTITRSHNCMPWRQKRRNEICWRIVKSLPSNWSKMLVLGTYWKTWYSLFSEQTCTIDEKWTKACDKRLSRLIFHHTCEYTQYCHVGNTSTTMQVGIVSGLWLCWRSCRLKIDLKVNLRIFGSHTFVPKSWMCIKQTSVSLSSTVSEIISLDAGLRMDGIPALDLWDLIFEVLHSSSNQPQKSKENVQGNLLHDRPSRTQTKNPVKTPIQYNDPEYSTVDYDSSIVKSSQLVAMLLHLWRQWSSCFVLQTVRNSAIRVIQVLQWWPKSRRDSA